MPVPLEGPIDGHQRALYDDAVRLLASTPSVCVGIPASHLEIWRDTVQRAERALRTAAVQAPSRPDRHVAPGLRDLDGVHAALAQAQALRDTLDRAVAHVSTGPMPHRPRLPAAERERVLATPYVPAEHLGDDWALLTIDDGTLYRHFEGATLRFAGAPDDDATHAELREGDAALADVVRTGCHLTDPARRHLLQRIRPGLSLRALEQAVEGTPITVRTLGAIPAGRGRVQSLHLIDVIGRFRRCALLHLVHDPAGVLLGVRLLEGAIGWAQLQALEDGVWEPDQPTVRAARTLHGLHLALRDALLHRSGDPRGFRTSPGHVGELPAPIGHPDVQVRLELRTEDDRTWARWWVTGDDPTRAVRVDGLLWTASGWVWRPESWEATQAA